MSLQFKENFCPNVLTTEPDEQAMLSSIRLIKRSYSDCIAGQQISTAYSKSIKQQNPILTSLFKSILEKHERNRREMNDLISQFTQQYEQIRQITIQWEDIEENEEQRTQHNEFLESMLERLETVSEQQLKAMTKLRLPQIAKELVEISGVSLQQLCEFIDFQGIVSGEQLIGLIRTGSFEHLKEEEPISDIGSFLLTEFGQLTVMLIVDKILTKKSEDEEEGLLNQKQFTIVNELIKGKNLDEEIQSDPLILLRLLNEYQMNVEMQQTENQILLASYQQIKQRLCEYIRSKQNYSQLVQKGFECQDPLGSGVISYQSFSRVFEKLKLLNPPQIQTLFRYCILVQRGTSVEMVDRSQKIGYFKLLSELLSTKTLVVDKEYQLMEQLRTQNIHLQRRMAQADLLINSLASQKQQLLVLVMECQQRVLKIQQQKTRTQAQRISEVEHIKRQFNNEQTVARVKAEAEIRRLSNVVENQNRVMESYRAELQNIMNQVQERHR